MAVSIVDSILADAVKAIIGAVDSDTEVCSPHYFKLVPISPESVVVYLKDPKTRLQEVFTRSLSTQ